MQEPHACVCVPNLQHGTKFAFNTRESDGLRLDGVTDLYYFQEGADGLPAIKDIGEGNVAVAYQNLVEVRKV